jgi:hypothetical protein
MNGAAGACVVFATLIAAVLPSYSQGPDESGVAALSRELAKKQSLSDAQTFTGLCAAMGKFAGKDGNTFTFQPRYYDLDKLIFRPRTSVDSNYRQTAWERDLQINIGITPNLSRVLENPKNCQLGCSFALANNKEIPLNYFDSLMVPAQTFFDVQKYLTAFISSMKNDTIRTMLRKIMNERCYSCLPRFIRDSVEIKFGMSFDTMMARPRRLVDSLGRFLLRRPQLVADIRGIHGLGNRGETGVDLKASFSSYLFSGKKRPIDPQANLSASVSFQDDSTRAHLNLNRIMLGISPGINVIFFSKVEFIPGVSFQSIFRGMHASGPRTTASPTLSVFVKAAEKMLVGFNAGYDSNTRQVSGNATLKASLE